MNLPNTNNILPFCYETENSFEYNIVIHAHVHAFTKYPRMETIPVKSLSTKKEEHQRYFVRLYASLLHKTQLFVYTLFKPLKELLCLITT